MLTKDLLRVDVRGKLAVPRWLKPDGDKDLQRAQELIDIVESHVGHTRGDLELQLKSATGRDFKVRRGLAKLLLDRAVIETKSDLVPATVRKLLFSMAAQDHPISVERRHEILEQAGQQMNCEPRDIEDALYADLAANQQISLFKGISASALIHRYNVALVQGALLRSHDMVIDLIGPDGKRLRQLLRFLKFYRLMYRVKRRPNGDYVFTIDGPVSVLKRSTRYGLNLANFFPALLLCESWRMRAEYQRAPRTRRGQLEIDSSINLQSHYPNTGMWVAAEESALISRLSDLADPWTVATADEIIELESQHPIIPDVVVSNPDTGARSYISIIWRWQKSALKKMDRALPPNLILAVCVTDASWEAKSSRIHTFKQTPNARTLLKMAKAAAS
jgi:predicted nuclease of restriction endonuclease-like RecB superfamily